MMPSVILALVSRMVLPTVVTFSLFLLVSGHNHPGGGFIGGLVAGAGLVLLWAVGGEEQVRSAVPIPAAWLIGSGLLTAQLTAALGWTLEGNLLQSEVYVFSLPVFGEIHLATPLLFDIGVYLVVVGLVLMILRTLGGQEPASADPQAEMLG